MMRLMSFPYQNYELTRFTKKTTNRSITLNGYKVGDWLIVAFANDYNESYRIYRLHDGLPAMKATFYDASDGIQCAEWLDKTYRDKVENDMSYFVIWTEYPHAEIFRWTQYTIPNGERYMKILEAMDTQKKIRWNDVSSYLR
jgi:hypothetical protein